ncbi:2-(R)-hydroxypropyl-CoM dehydrogenase [Madurella fahalii]|uniref:2-(R)-hydroxypropyl-CoM dehydrogenase n=1 Tax=Madurella fahalii TaxID=1157608 RepID=A0ABQ0GQD7_9PEZI
MTIQAAHPKTYSFTPKSHNDTYPAIDPATASDCSGKAVLVTGANRGLGKAFALSYAKAGASYIAIGSRSDASETVKACLEAAKDAGKPSPTVIQVKLDVTDQACVGEAAERVHREFGRLDILVNNSGYMGPLGPLCEQPVEVYRRTWDVIFWGTYNVTRAFLPLMLEGGDKTVIQLSSIGACWVKEGSGAYSIAKLAVCRLAEMLDAEYGEQGVLSYSYHPGGVLTELSSNLPPELQVYLCDTAELAGDTLVFLTSKKRDWLAGRYISANWDMPQLMAMEEEVSSKDLLKFKCDFGS